MSNAMSAGSNLESGISAEVAVVAIMGVLFGVFLLGSWWEMRTVLREVSREQVEAERAAVRAQSEAAFAKQIAQQQAAHRLNRLRAVETPRVVEAQPQPQPASGMEHIGRILERLAQAAPDLGELEEARPFEKPALSMVRGGQAAQPEGEAAPKKPRRSKKSTSTQRSGNGFTSAAVPAGAMR
jgi:uncharacterized membrane protein YccC